MAVDIETLNQVINDYVSDVKKTIPIDRVFLFGSYANGTATEYSDVDLCFFSYSFENKRSIDLIAHLLSMTHKYMNVFIEPHVFPTSELENDNPFVKEILRTGREIIAA